MPFSKEAREIIGKRDNWTCRCGCGKSYLKGYMMQAAHYPDRHRRGTDDNPKNGRILATECHIMEEIRRGNYRGARLLYQNMSFRTYSWIEKNGGLDVKPPFAVLVQNANRCEC